MKDPYGFPADKTWWTAQTSILGREAKRLVAIVKAAFGYDIVHYNFGTTLAQPPLYERGDRGTPQHLLSMALVAYRRLLQHLELGLMRALRRQVFVTYQGDDARIAEYQVDLDISLLKINPDNYSTSLDRQRLRQIHLLDRYAYAIYAVNPDLLHALPCRARFVPYSHIDADQIAPHYPLIRPNGCLVVGHAPTHRLGKGTEHVIASVRELEEEGCGVELKLVEGLSHDAAMQEYEGVDILVDQLYAGWYGGLAVELMAMGKPVLAYIRQGELDAIDANMRDDLPVVNVSVDTLKAVLRDIATTGKEHLGELGVASRSFVQKWHSPAAVASEIEQDYLAAIRRG